MFLHAFTANIVRVSYLTGNEAQMAYMNSQLAERLKLWCVLQ